MRTTESASLDFDARYTVDGWRGIAFYLLGYVEETIMYEDGFPEYAYADIIEETVTDYDRVIAVMVGDDRKHIVDVADLTPLEDDDYCAVCGQIGCGHDGR